MPGISESCIPASVVTVKAGGAVLVVVGGTYSVVQYDTRSVFALSFELA